MGVTDRSDGRINPSHCGARVERVRVARLRGLSQRTSPDSAHDINGGQDESAAKTKTNLAS